VTLTVKLADPAVVGVPDIAPPADKLSPAGNDPPDTDHEYGGDPPDAASVCEYATPTVPAGSDDVVMPSAGGLIVSDNAAVFDVVALSVTLTVKLADPAAVGVPDIAPPVDRLNPAGSDPADSDHEYGGDPPDAANVCEYATPTVPAGSDDVVMPSAGGLIVSDRAAVVDAAALSVTLTVKFTVPAAVGVPDIAPPVDRLNPAGNDPADSDHEYGSDPPDADSVCEYPTPTVPAGNDDVVTRRGGGSGFTVSDSACVSLPPALSVNFTVKFDVPAACGVPVMAPVGGAILNPCGRLPCEMPHVTGDTAPDAAIVAEYAEPAVAFGSEVVVIVGLESIVIARVWVSESFFSSETLAVNWKVPWLGGVPLMTPALLIVSPPGRVPPDTDHE
jgi:hypothetical protein